MTPRKRGNQVASQKYLDLIMEAVREISQDIKEVRQHLSEQNIELTKVKSEMSKNNEHMVEYNEQLDIHIKGVQLAHKMASEQDKRIVRTEESIRKIETEIFQKLDIVYDHIQESKHELEFRKKLEEEKEARKEKLYKYSKFVTTIIGVPLATYGLIEMIITIISRIGN